MSDEQLLGTTPQVTRILMSEEAIYGLILVSGMIVVSYDLAGTSLNALITVVVTVIVFFAAHVYAGTLARLAATDGKAGLPESIRAAVHHSLGMLLVSLAPVAVLLLGVTKVVDDDFAIWCALSIDAIALGHPGLARGREMDAALLAPSGQRTDDRGLRRSPHRAEGAPAPLRPGAISRRGASAAPRQAAGSAPAHPRQVPPGPAECG